MSTPLKRFLAVLATDLDRLEEYLHDPDGVIQKAGLSPEDVAALKSGDPASLEARFDCYDSLPAMSHGQMIEPGSGITTFTHLQMIETSYLIQTVTNINVVDSSVRIPTFTYQVIVETVARESSAETLAAPEVTDQEQSQPSPGDQGHRPRIVPPPMR